MSETGRTTGPPQVINAALFKMATRSMAEAYKILGLRPHHGLDGTSATQWELLERAAEATWPDIVGPHAGSAATTPPPARFTRAQWDEIWGEYDVTTATASPFTEELLRAYPEAKVVVVQRSFESWWPSYRAGILDLIFRRALDLVLLVAAVPAVSAPRKMALGFYGVRRRSEITEQHAREVYERYFRRVRELVPEERRLDYKLGSGWGPLCEFLGKEIPDVPFPRVNESEEFATVKELWYRSMLLKGFTAIRSWAFTTLSMGVLAAAIRYGRYGKWSGRILRRLQ